MHVDKTGLIMPESRTHSLESGWRERAQQGAGLHEPNGSDGGGCGSVGSDGGGYGMPSALRSAAAASRSDICGT